MNCIYYAKRYLSALLIVALLFSGMCLNEFSTNSFFVFSNTTSPSEASIRGWQPSTDAPTFCTTELLGQQEITRTNQRTRRVNETLRTRLAFYPPLVEVLPNLYAQASATEVRCLSFVAFSTAIIVYYIHHQDGKKPELFFL